MQIRIRIAGQGGGGITNSAKVALPRPCALLGMLPRMQFRRFDTPPTLDRATPSPYPRTRASKRPIRRKMTPAAVTEIAVRGNMTFQTQTKTA